MIQNLKYSRNILSLIVTRNWSSNAVSCFPFSSSASCGKGGVVRVTVKNEEVTVRQTFLYYSTHNINSIRNFLRNEYAVNFSFANKFRHKNKNLLDNNFYRPQSI
jgi:hypothetical protein